MQTNRFLAFESYADILRDAEHEGAFAVREVMRGLARTDLYFLMTRLLERKDFYQRKEINPDWLYERCVEVQANPDGMLDLWAREHYKSTIITFGKSIQDILIDPEITIGIFSVKRELAQDFLKQIKQEFENNRALIQLFDDILYDNPARQSPSWGIQNGLRVKRVSNSREETVEAWGLMGGGMPTGKHFKMLVYDDVVTQDSVTNEDTLNGAYDKMRLSFDLGAHGGRRRFIGTRYHANDAWGRMLKDETAEPRVHAATHDGKPDGNAVFITAEALAEKRRSRGPYIFACQMLQNPLADEAQGFNEEWLRYCPPFDVSNKVPSSWNLYLIVDPAGEKKKENDYSVYQVIGLAPDGNYYLIDGVRDRMNLTERTDTLFRLHRKWKPVRTAYEKYGMQSDVEHIRYEMNIRNYRFSIIEIGGNTPKKDRIRKLVPVYEQGRFYVPTVMPKRTVDGTPYDFVQVFIDDELTVFPVGVHDDMLDCQARIVDPQLGAVHPKEDSGMDGEIGAGRVSSMVTQNNLEYDIFNY